MRIRITGDEARGRITWGFVHRDNGLRYTKKKGRCTGDTDSERKAKNMESQEIIFKRMRWSKRSETKEGLRRKTSANSLNLNLGEQVGGRESGRGTGRKVKGEEEGGKGAKKTEKAAMADFERLLSFLSSILIPMVLSNTFVFAL